ncbi:hypothetical protein FBQ85_25700, partial [Cytophagia bacterium CHB2]|nr:hypothetical protein [Cytophagia bacterium CHB2]
ATAGPDFPKQAQKVTPRTETLKTNLSEALYHSAEFTGLQPDTVYAYRVGDGANWSEWNQFRSLDLDKIKSLLKTPLVIDLRNIYEPSKMIDKGFKYYSVGR